MSWLLRLLQKAGEKAVRTNPVDIITQQTGDDIIHLIKELLL